jgi:hypothetical protein
MEFTVVDNVFDNFELTPYTFLEVTRGGVYGNRITATHSAEGVFKLRSEMVMVNNQEVRRSAATLHVKPDESFISSIAVGQGIRVEGQDYEIIGQTGGKNYEDGELEHYTLTLQNTDYSEYTEDGS